MVWRLSLAADIAARKSSTAMTKPSDPGTVTAGLELFGAEVGLAQDRGERDGASVVLGGSDASAWSGAAVGTWSSHLRQGSGLVSLSGNDTGTQEKGAHSHEDNRQLY